MSEKMELCANCGKTYADHLPSTQCQPGSPCMWFPSQIAVALKRQQMRIRRAQAALGKERKRDAD
jgi:hypothetical protein